jgi:asparaginyl-tRNA synthetase
MTKTRVTDILRDAALVGATVTVEGWVRTRRDSKAGLSFVNVHDGSCFAALQIIADAALPNYEAEVKRLTAGCAVRVIGVVVASPAAGQAVEVRAQSVEVVGWVDDPETYPMQPKRHTVEFLREHAHLRPRTNLIGAVTRVRNTLAFATHRFFQERGFSWIHTPIITGSDAEGAGQMFKVSTLDLVNLPRTPEGAIDHGQDFFGRPAHLTVSGQLNVECYCMAMSRVYTFGPTFRAENSNTRRHLAEFWMIEPEIAFAQLADVADLATDYLKFLFRAALDERGDDLAFCAERVSPGVIQRLEAFVNAPVQRITYTDAIATLLASGADRKSVV